MLFRSVRERRFPIVDEERGLVYAIVFFDHAGTVRTVKMANGTSFNVPPPYDTPYTFLIGELFKIKNGRIHQIEAVLPSIRHAIRLGRRDLPRRTERIRGSVPGGVGSS